MEFLFAPAFTLWGAPATWLELLAFVLALAMVGCNIREIHWGWPLAILSSLLYFGVFWRSKLYGDAVLQIFFAVVALWGWVQWLRGQRGDGSPLRVARLTQAALVAAVAAFLGYTAWIMRRIWLNAPNVERPELGTMARVLTIGWTINAVTGCTFLVLAKLGGQPLQFLQ